MLYRQRVVKNKMIVTQITELSKNRSKVYIDQEFAFVLYKGELRLYHIQEGEEVRQQDYENIIRVILPKRAKLRAMNLLQKRTYTEKQLRDKLQEGFYPSDILEQAIVYVKSFHYLNDEQYALDYITYNEERKTIRQMEVDLYKKGINREIFQKACTKWEELNGRQDEESMIQKLLEKKNYQKDCDIKEKQKIFAFLMRKGYSAETIRRVMHLEND